MKDMKEATVKELVEQATNQVTPSINQPVNLSEQPERFNYAGGRFEIRDNGVFFIESDDSGNNKGERWICSKLNVLAVTRDVHSHSWGRLLRWCDLDGKTHQWSAPMSLFATDSAELRAELLNGGLVISSAKSGRDRLAAYIQSYPTKKHVLCVDKIGWNDNKYILPFETIGDDDNNGVVFQSDSLSDDSFSCSGTLEEWKKNVSSLAIGNSRLIFALSTGFAGPLLSITNVESGCFHITGRSSKGKSTIQRVAASIWGNPDKFKKSWRTTANALESIAVTRNDNILILDELSEANIKEIGASIYMLANGSGKSRANRIGTNRPVMTWRLLVLSSGEDSLQNMMAENGQRTRAGQEIRLAEVDIGDFENTHDFETGQFVDTLRVNTLKYFGSIGIEYLRLLVTKRGEYAELFERSINNFVFKYVPPNASGQIHRVAKRFGLVAAAGELATGFGLTGWTEGSAAEAVVRCFNSWLETFGNIITDREFTSVLEQTKLFFELHGASRFSPLDIHDRTLQNRAGFYSVSNDLFGNNERLYYLLPEVLKNEVLKGLNFKTAIQVLIEAGWIMPGNGRSAQKIRIPAFGNKPSSVYVFSEKVWQDKTDDSEAM